MRKGLVVTSFAVFALVRTVQAQQTGDTTLKRTTIEVIQSYKPEVKQETKPEFKPDLPPRDTSRPAFRYDVPQQALYYSYSSLPLRPLALGKDTTALPFSSYLKLGGGTQSTIYADAGIAALRGEHYETSIHLHHVSQDGNIKNQKVSLSGIEAEGTLHTNAHAWRLSLEGLRNRYHFYGYDHDKFDYARDTIQQTYSGFQATLDLRNERSNSLGLNYHPRVGGYIYGDDHETKERTMVFDVPFIRDIDTSMQVGIGINGMFTRLSMRGKDIDNNIFQITPQAVFHSGGFAGKVGIYPTFGSNGNTFLLPDLSLRYQIPNTQFALTAGWEAKLRQNTYRQLSGLNPYVFNVYETQQTRSDEVFGMLSSNIGNHFSFSGRVSWWQFNNLPMFLNDSLDRKNFYIIYDELVNAVSFQASIRYQVANTFSIGATGTFTSFNKKTYDRVWHEPGIRIKGDAMLRPLPALNITVYAMLLDQIYALNELHETTKLDAIFDVGGSAEYQFVPRLSAFINLNNLFSSRYERWYGYNSYGMNVFGGLRLKF